MKKRFSTLMRFTGLAATVWLLFVGVRFISGLPQGFSNLFTLSTTVTPSGPVVLDQVQRLNRLETCRYNEQVIVRGETKGVLPTWLVGDRILFVGRGEVVGGVDLSKVSPADLQVNGREVSLRLPKAEILHTRLDNRQSEVFARETGLFSKADADLESQVRVRAEEQLQEAALAHSLLKDAERNAREALSEQLTRLGFSEVRFL